MTDISELEGRITAALERIGTGVQALSATPPEPEAAPVDEGELARLREALDIEKEANAQLEERVRVLKGRLESNAKAVEAELETLKTQAREAQGQMQKLRAANQQLRGSVEALRKASAEGGGVEPHLINQAMMSELDGLRAARAGDRAEIDAILTELKPLLQENADA